MKEKLLIGIDPDTIKSGFAMTINDKIFLQNSTFFELFEEFKMWSRQSIKPVIYIECGFLNQSNWHKKANGSSALNSKIGERTGANFEVAKKICEMCEYLGLEYRQVRPTKSKLNSETFNQITGWKGRSNQEQRDALMLIWGK